MTEARENHAPGAGSAPRNEQEPSPRIGVYVCHCGGNISDTVDVERVAEAASRLPGVVVARTNTFMCSDPGQALIVEDIEKHRLNRVVVASCSPSLHETTFRTAVSRGGLNPFLYEHANIREQVSWVHHDREEATAKATVLVAAAVAKARKLQPLEPIRVPAEPRALVVGGGVAGLRAALDLARRGLAVTLVEKQPELGGHVRSLGSLYPTAEQGRELVEELVRQVRSEPRIELLTGAEVTAASGYVGNFTASVRQGEQERKLRAGAVVVATGFEPYEPWKGEYGYGRRSRVLTLPRFLELLRDAPDGPLSFEGEPVRRVAFIHCVGSREVEGVHKPRKRKELHTWCSRTCCTTVMKTIQELGRRWPQVKVVDFYRDIRTYGRGHEELYEEACKLGTLFVRFDPEKGLPKVRKAAEADGGHLLVSAPDTLTFGEEVEVAVDLVVLAVGMLPAPVGGLASSLKLPRGEDGFLQEVHPKLRPVEVNVAGVVIAGTAQGPKDIQESTASASAAAAKAASLLGRGQVELDPYVAVVDPARCEGTGKCVEACAYSGALHLEEREGGGRVAVVNPALCAGCGACAAVCPNRAIQLAGWTLDQFDAMVDAIVETAGARPAGEVAP